jgi:hypothetical protein
MVKRSIQYLDSLVGAPRSGLGGEELGLRGVLDEGQAGVLEHGGLVDQQPRRVHLDAHGGDLLLDGVQRGDGLAEGLAILGVPVTCGVVTCGVVWCGVVWY